MKKMKRKLKHLIAVFTVLISIGVLTVLSQSNNSCIIEKKITLKMNNESLGNIFHKLIDNYDVAIGFEESTFDAIHNDYLYEVNVPIDYEDCLTDCRKGIAIGKDSCSSSCEQRVFNTKEKKISINVKNEPLDKVLDEIVLKLQYYKWDLNNGVINIYPIIGVNERYRDLLKIKIKNFSLLLNEKGETNRVSKIREEIFKLPEVKEFLKTKNLFFSGSRIFSPNLRIGLKENLMFSDLTLKELLNKITNIKRGGWILKRSILSNGGNHEFVEIDI